MDRQWCQASRAGKKTAIQKNRPGWHIYNKRNPKSLLTETQRQRAHAAVSYWVLLSPIEARTECFAAGRKILPNLWSLVALWVLTYWLAFVIGLRVSSVLLKKSRKRTNAQLPLVNLKWTQSNCARCTMLKHKWKLSQGKLSLDVHQKRRNEGTHRPKATL